MLIDQWLQLTDWSLLFALLQSVCGFISVTQPAGSQRGYTTHTHTNTYTHAECLWSPAVGVSVISWSIHVAYQVCVCMCACGGVNSGFTAAVCRHTEKAGQWKEREGVSEESEGRWGEQGRRTHGRREGRKRKEGGWSFASVSQQQRQGEAGILPLSFTRLFPPLVSVLYSSADATSFHPSLSLLELEEEEGGGRGGEERHCDTAGTDWGATGEKREEMSRRGGRRREEKKGGEIKEVELWKGRNKVRVGEERWREERGGEVEIMKKER